jgi:hypothetical protein
MSLTIAGLLFTGGFKLEKTVTRANQEPALYAVVAKRGPDWDPQFVLIDVGETGESGMNFASHPSRSRWEAALPGEPPVLYLHVMPRAETDAAGRNAAVSAIRQSYSEPNMIIRG